MPTVVGVVYDKSHITSTCPAAHEIGYSDGAPITCAEEFVQLRSGDEPSQYERSARRCVGMRTALRERDTCNHSVELNNALRRRRLSLRSVACQSSEPPKIPDSVGTEKGSGSAGSRY